MTNFESGCTLCGQHHGPETFCLPAYNPELGLNTSISYGAEQYLQGHSPGMFSLEPSFASSSFGILTSVCSRCGEEHGSMVMCPGRGGIDSMFQLSEPYNCDVGIASVFTQTCGQCGRRHGLGMCTALLSLNAPVAIFDEKCIQCGQQHGPETVCLPAYNPELGLNTYISYGAEQYLQGHSPGMFSLEPSSASSSFGILTSVCSRCGEEHGSMVMCPGRPGVTSFGPQQGVLITSPQEIFPWETQSTRMVLNQGTVLLNAKCTLCGEEHSQVIVCTGRGSVTSFSPQQNAMIATAQETLGIDASFISPTSLWQEQGVSVLSAQDTFLRYDAQSPTTMLGEADVLSLSRDSLSFGRLGSLDEFADTLANRITMNVRSVVGEQGENVRDIIVQVLVMANSLTGNIYQIGIETHATNGN